MWPITFLLSAPTAFLMAWAIGAQDVSNALGTSVGSKALTVRQAIYVAAICEFAGSLMGGKVAGMISGGILDVDRFEADAARDGGALDLYARIMFCTMAGAFAWLGIATLYSLPVSTTHSLVGALLGVGLTAVGTPAIFQGSNVALLCSSWFSSPLLGGLVAYATFNIIHKRILVSEHPRRAAARDMPLWLALTAFCAAYFLAANGPYHMSALSAMATAGGVGWLVFLVQRHRGVGAGVGVGARTIHRTMSFIFTPLRSQKSPRSQAKSGDGESPEPLALTGRKKAKGLAVVPDDGGGGGGGKGSKKKAHRSPRGSAKKSAGGEVVVGGVLDEGAAGQHLRDRLGSGGARGKDQTLEEDVPSATDSSGSGSGSATGSAGGIRGARPSAPTVSDLLPASTLEGRRPVSPGSPALRRVRRG